MSDWSLQRASARVRPKGGTGLASGSVEGPWAFKHYWIVISLEMVFESQRLCSCKDIVNIPTVFLHYYSDLRACLPRAGVLELSKCDEEADSGILGSLCWD